GGEGDRYPELLAVRREVETGRHDAEDGVRLAVHPDVAPDDAGIGAEPPRPEAMAEDDHPLATRLVLARAEDPAALGRDAEDVEERGGDAGADRPFGRLPLGEVEARELDRRHS